MNLSVVDNIVIQAALRSKADYYNEQIEKYPSDKFWTDKLNDVKTAYRNFSDRELEIGEQTNGRANTYRPNDLGY